MSKLRARLHGGGGPQLRPQGFFFKGKALATRLGGPQIGEITCGGSPQLSCKRDQIKMRDYMDRWVTPPKRVTSPTWGPPPPYKQALTYRN